MELGKIQPDSPILLFEGMSLDSADILDYAVHPYFPMFDELRLIRRNNRQHRRHYDKMDDMIKNSRNPMIIATEDSPEHIEHITSKLNELQPKGPRTIVLTYDADPTPKFEGNTKIVGEICFKRFAPLTEFIKETIQPKEVNIFGAYLWKKCGILGGCVGTTYNALSSQLPNTEVKLLERLCCD